MRDRRGVDGLPLLQLHRHAPGAVSPSSGEIRIVGKCHLALTPRLSRDEGVGIIYQHFQVIEGLSGADNSFPGYELKRAGIVGTIVFTLAVGTLIGVVNGVMVCVLSMSPIIVTLGGLTLMRGIAQWLAPNPLFGFPEAFTHIGYGRVLGLRLRVRPAGNFMVRMSGDEILDMKLIDFEFSSNNERAYEIGVFLAEVFADEETTLEMIERYYGQVTPGLVARVWVARAVADMKWGSWAVQQRQMSGWDFDYQKYGIWKYAPARLLFDDPRCNDWLRQIWQARPTASQQGLKARCASARPGRNLWPCGDTTPGHNPPGRTGAETRCR